ncbi:MAG: RimK/LysX family protein [Gammaproteobacteria bacterium]
MKTEPRMSKIISSTLLTIFITVIALYANNVWAKDPAKIIVGWIEKVRIEDQEFDVKAKLDTGARTSSIHAKDIKSYKKDGVRWVKFTLMLVDSKDNKHEIQMEKQRSRRTNIKNHDGEHDKRHVVDFDVCFNGQKFTTEFTLADRREYIYDVLLGRQFLKKIAIIDPDRVFLTTTNCK